MRPRAESTVAAVRWAARSTAHDPAIEAFRRHQVELAEKLVHAARPFFDAAPADNPLARANAFLVGLIYEVLANPQTSGPHDLSRLSRILAEQCRAAGQSTRKKGRDPTKPTVPFRDIVRQVYGVNWHGKE